eukprot:scaffold30403_cov53-Attheya_sp.AAC.3
MKTYCSIFGQQTSSGNRTIPQIQTGLKKMQQPSSWRKNVQSVQYRYIVGYQGFYVGYVRRTGAQVGYVP